MRLASPSKPDTEGLLSATARVPQHVVHRTFVTETVLLNLQTGKYHGVNPVGGKMLEEMEKGSTLKEVAATLAARFSRPVDQIERDLCAFCVDLQERNLIELDGSS
jgi:hypothetical protein